MENFRKHSAIFIASLTIGAGITASDASADTLYYVSNAGKLNSYNTLTSTIVSGVTTPIQNVWAADNSGDVFGTALNGSTLYAQKNTASSQAWSYNTSSQITSVKYLNGNVYVQNSSGYVYSLNGTTGTLNWSFSVGTGNYYTKILPDATGSTIYVASNSGTVYALNTSNGSLKFSKNVGTSISALNVTPSGSLIVSAATTVYGLNGATGTTNWTYTDGNSHYQIVSDSNGHVYLGGESNYLVTQLSSSTGALLATKFTGSYNYQMVLGANNDLVVANYAGVVYDYSLSNFSQNWSYNTGQNVFMGDLGVSSNGDIFVANWYGTNPIKEIGPSGSLIATLADYSNSAYSVFAFATGADGSPTLSTPEPSTIFLLSVAGAFYCRQRYGKRKGVINLKS